MQNWHNSKLQSDELIAQVETLQAENEALAAKNEALEGENSTLEGENSTKANNIINGLKPLWKATQFVLNKIKVSIPSISFLSLLKISANKFFDNRSHVLIFDDCERTLGTNIVRQVFSLISNLFLEDKDYKVIIIGDITKNELKEITITF